MLPLSRRSFLASVAAAIAAPLAWAQRPVVVWRSKLWVAYRPSSAQRVYFSRLHDPAKWPEAVTIRFDDVR